MKLHLPADLGMPDHWVAAPSLVACPTCDRKVGNWCMTSKSRKPGHYHRARIKLSASLADARRTKILEKAGRSHTSTA